MDNLDSTEIRERCQTRINSLKLEIERLERIKAEGVDDHSVTEWSCYHDQPYCVICNRSTWELDMENEAEVEDE